LLFDLCDYVCILLCGGLGCRILGSFFSFFSLFLSFRMFALELARFGLLVVELLLERKGFVIACVRLLWGGWLALLQAELLRGGLFSRSLVCLSCRMLAFEGDRFSLRVIVVILERKGFVIARVFLPRGGALALL